MITVITDSIKSVNRIIRRKNNAGEKTYGIEAVTALGLAWKLVIEKASSGGIVPIHLINNNTAAAIVLELMLMDKTLLPFVPEESMCLSTAREVLNCMNLLRCNKYKRPAGARAEQLLKLSEKYESTLRGRNLYDSPMVLKEAIGLLKDKEAKLPETEIETCYFRTPSMLESEFVNCLGTHCEFPKPETGEKEFRFVKTYGIVNEADYIAKEIVENNIPLGDVEVLCDTAVYAPFIEESFAKRGIGYSFTSGVSASCFSLIRLLKDLIGWYTSGCSYQALFPVVHNPLFAITVDGKEQRASYPYLKGISYGIGWGAKRYLGIDQRDGAMSGGTEDEICKKFREEELPALGKLAENLDAATSAVLAFDCLSEYAKAHTRKRNQENRFTTNALRLLRKNMSAVKLTFSDSSDLLDYLSNELDSVAYSSQETGNTVSISDIHSPMCMERTQIYVPGLSAKEFKVSTAESPVLGDELRKELFGNPPCGNVTLAAAAVDDAEQVVTETIKSAPEGANITVLSSSSDVMRDCSDVSVSSLFEKLREEMNSEVRDETGYYEITDHAAKISHDDAWGGYNVSWQVDGGIIERTFSKSTLDEFLKCPLCYHYDKELHINKEEYTDYDPGSWLAANSKGTLVHSILQYYAESVLLGNEDVSESFDRECEEFKEAVRKAAAEAETANAAPNAEVREKERRECEEMAARYLTELHRELHDTGWVVFGCEEKMEPDKSAFGFKAEDKNFRLTFSGTIDRIDRRKNPDGSFIYRIADYKTGKGKTAKEMLDSTKQHLIYANYVKSKYKGDVDSFDYLFLKELLEENDWIAKIAETDLKGEIVSSEQGRDGLSEQEKFYRVFAQHDYRSVECNDCKYCRYKDICLYDLAEKKPRIIQSQTAAGE